MPFYKVQIIQTDRLQDYKSIGHTVCMQLKSNLQRSICFQQALTHLNSMLCFFTACQLTCIGIAKLVLLSAELQLAITPEKGNKNRFRWCYNESMNTNYYTHIIMGIYQHCTVCVLTLCVLQQFILHRSGTVGILNLCQFSPCPHEYDRYEETTRQ